jgi:hypothetical protein
MRLRTGVWIVLMIAVLSLLNQHSISFEMVFWTVFAGSFILSCVQCARQPLAASDVSR